MKELLDKGKKAREAALFLAQASTSAKDRVLNGVADALNASAAYYFIGQCNGIWRMQKRPD